MTIDHVTIDNFTHGDFWKHVESKPDEALIKATIKMTLSFKEYADLIKMDRRGRDVVSCLHTRH